MTATIQPPLLSWAWRIAAGDPAEVPTIVRHQDRVERGHAPCSPTAAPACSTSATLNTVAHARLHCTYESVIARDTPTKRWYGFAHVAPCKLDQASR